MPAPSRRPILLVLALGGVTLCLGAWVRWGPGALRRLGLAEPAGSTRPPQPADLPGDVVTEEVARLILPGLGRNPRLQYDPVAIITNVPDIEFTFAWAEDPDGEVTFHNDAHGFRRRPDADADVPPGVRGARVLVLGDSHTYGLVDTDDTFCSLLELGLRGRAAGPGTVVWNAAVAGSGPFEYVGSARRFLGTGPDLVVVVVFTGNDFMNALPYDEFFSKQRPPVPDRAMRQRLSDARTEHTEWRAPIAQGLSQALEFSSAPEEGERALAAATGALRELVALCGERHVPLLVALLPTKLDVDGDDDRATIDAMLAKLDLTRGQYAWNERLGARLGEALAGPGVTVLDLAPGLRDEPRPKYWRQDHHLSVVGHRLVARLLLDAVGALLPAPP